MTSFANITAKFKEQIAQLPDDELTVLTQLLCDEKDARDAERERKRLIEAVNNAIKAIDVLTEAFDYLDSEEDTEIYLTDIIEGLEKLKKYI